MKKLIVIFILLSSLKCQCQYYQDIDLMIERLKKASNLRQKFIISDGIFLNYYYHNGNKDSTCKVICDSMMQIAVKLKNDSFIARTYILYDVYYSSTGNYVKTMQCIKKAIEHAKKVTYTAAICSAYKEYASIYKSLEYYETAIKDLKIAETYLTQKSDVFSYYHHNRIYYTMAEVFMRLNELDSAKKYAYLCETNTNKVTDPYGYAKLLNVYGHIYKTIDLTISEAYFKKSIAFCEEQKYYFPLIVSCMDYSLILFDHSNYISSKNIASKCLKYATKINSKLRVSQSAHLLEKIYIKLNSKIDSIIYYSNLSDSMAQIAISDNQNSQIINAIIEDDSEYKNEKARNEVLKNEQVHNIEYVGLSLGVIILFSLFLLSSRTIIVNRKVLTFLLSLGFLIFFELVSLLFHHFVFKIIDGKIYYTFFVIVIFAAILFPIHHKLQKVITEKLINKNNEIRLRSAKQTIDELNSNL